MPSYCSGLSLIQAQIHKALDDFFKLYFPTKVKSTKGERLQQITFSMAIKKCETHADNFLKHLNMRAAIMKEDVERKKTS